MFKGIRESHSAPFDEVDSRNNSPKKFQNIPEKSDSPQSRRYSNNSTDTHRRRRFKSYSPPNERKSRRNSMDSYKNRRFHSGSRDSNHKFKNYQKTLPLGYLDSKSILFLKFIEHIKEKSGLLNRLYTRNGDKLKC